MDLLLLLFSGDTRTVAKMKTFVCLTVLVTAARATPSIRTAGGNVVIQGSDLRFTHDDASSVPISFTAREPAQPRSIDHAP